jgi:hypothetical protein
MMKSYSSRTCASRSFNRRSRPSTLINSISAPERSRVAGMIDNRSVDVGRMKSRTLTSVPVSAS